MKNATIYDFNSKTKKSIPQAELSSNMVKAQLLNGSVVWVDATKVKTDRPPIHPPFSESKRQILRQLKTDLDEVFPTTLAEWEQKFRCDVHPDREIRIWRWIAYQYKSLIRSEESSAARKRDYFQLCLRWTMTKDVAEVLACVQLDEIPREEAKLLLETFVTIPSEFFGGNFAKLNPGRSVYDYAAINDLELKEVMANASVIIAVDWQEADTMRVVHGLDILKSIRASSQALEVPMIFFAVDFDSDQLEQLEATVAATKVRVNLKPKNITSDIFGMGKTGLWLPPL